MGSLHLSTDAAGLTASFDGDLDIYSVAALKSALWPAIEQTTSLAIDLSQVEEIDLAGVQLLAWVRAVAQRTSASWRIIDASAGVRAAVRSLGLHEWLPGAPS